MGAPVLNNLCKSYLILEAFMQQRRERVCLDTKQVAANRVVGRSLAHADIRNAFQQLVGEHNVAALAAFDTAKVTDSELHSAQ